MSLSPSTRLSDPSVTINRKLQTTVPMEGIVKVENDRANELLIAFRKGQRIQEFMDAVSGVENYKLSDLSRQGCIRGRFAKELVKDQFLLELEDIISMFWQGVFEHVDKARLWNDKVEIKNPGKDVEIRETNNNPIHYLRCHGEYAVRNYITGLYRKNLQQSCMACDYTCSIQNDKTCKKCKGLMHTTYKFMEINDDLDDFLTDSPDKEAENRDLDRYVKALFKKFAAEVLKEGRAFQIFNILTEPEASKEMCGACNLCPAQTFDINSCTNYNANIGAYLGVNKTMVANKMRSIRKRFPQFLTSEGTLDAAHILDLIPKKYRALLPIID